MFSASDLQVIRSGVRTVWNAIAPDCDFVRSNAEAVEMCIDAGRLERDGGIDGQQAQFIISECTAPYNKIRKYLAKEIKLL